MLISFDDKRCVLGHGVEWLRFWPKTVGPWAMARDQLRCGASWAGVAHTGGGTYEAFEVDTWPVGLLCAVQGTKRQLVNLY